MTISARCVMTCTGAQFMQTESSPRYSRQVCQINADTHRVMPRPACSVFTATVTSTACSNISRNCGRLPRHNTLSVRTLWELYCSWRQSRAWTCSVFTATVSEHAVVILADTKPQYSFSPNSVRSLLFLKAGKQNYLKKNNLRYPHRFCECIGKNKTTTKNQTTLHFVQEISKNSTTVLTQSTESKWI